MVTINEGDSTLPYYIFIPSAWKNNIYISNTIDAINIDNENVHTIYDLLTDPSLSDMDIRIEEILVDGIYYVSMKTIPNCKAIRLEYKNN